MNGTITELQVYDGVGWITLDAGGRIRFGGTVCKGFAPVVGTRVRVLGTAPGYGGVTKATALAPLDPPAPTARPRAPSVRADRAKLDALGAPADDLLRALVARSDADDAFHADLERIAFELAPMRAEELDCEVPELAVVAMNGGGSAYGIWTSAPAPGAWVYWEHEDDSLHHIADDTAQFLSRLLAFACVSPANLAVAERIRRVCAELGHPLPPAAPPEPGAFHEGRPASWLRAIAR
jgi:hypothetical protein